MWVFGSLFVLSGLGLLTIVFTTDAWSDLVLWERASAVAIGVGHFLGGAWTIGRYVETHTTFDRATGEGLYVVRRPFRRQTKTTRFNVGDVRAIEVERSTDSDGDAMYQLRMWLSGSRFLRLQGQPVHGESKTNAAASRLRQALAV